MRRGGELKVPRGQKYKLQFFFVGKCHSFVNFRGRKPSIRSKENLTENYRQAKCYSFSNSWFCPLSLFGLYFIIIIIIVLKILVYYSCLVFYFVYCNKFSLYKGNTKKAIKFARSPYFKVSLMFYEMWLLLNNLEIKVIMIIIICCFNTHWFMSTDVAISDLSLTHVVSAVKAA